MHLNKWDNKPSGGGLLDVEPGKGKTVMALNIISKLKVGDRFITSERNLFLAREKRIKYNTQGLVKKIKKK